jgi:guanylate kinase
LPQQTNLDHPTTTATPGIDGAQLEAICREGDDRINGLMASRTGRVFIISGPSGVGKDSVLEKLRDVYPDAQYVVTATSRPMRPGEIDGVHYRFLDRADFERQIADGDFIEHALVYDNLYGVPRRPIVEGLRSDRHVIIKVDVKGAETLRGAIANTVSLFLLPESMSSLLERLRSRKTEDPAVLLKRFRTANEELARVEEFDYAVFNEAGKLDQALQHIVGIIEAERQRVDLPAITIA